MSVSEQSLYAIIDEQKIRITELDDTITHYASDDFGDWLEGMHELWTQAEGENERLRDSLLAIHDSPRGDVIALQEELAELKARRCFTCTHNGVDCTRGPFSWMDDLATLEFCSEWAERGLDEPVDSTCD